MGLLSKNTNGPVPADGVGTHPQQHHLGRDAALVGGAGLVAAEAHHHHEKKKLGGGLFSKRKSMDQPIAPGAVPVAGAGAPMVADAHGNAVPVAAANGNNLTTGFGTGAGETTGFSGAHTGPAPMVGNTAAVAAPAAAGVGAGAVGAGAVANGTTSPGVNGLNTNGVPAAAGTLKDANKLDRKGNMESLVGGLLCSTSMKQKAATHHAQADHLRMQASELDEAERLEHEAGMRRQRAVGLGADPAHATGQTGFAPGAPTAVTT